MTSSSRIAGCARSTRARSRHTSAEPDCSRTSATPNFESGVGAVAHEPALVRLDHGVGPVITPVGHPGRFGKTASLHPVLDGAHRAVVARGDLLLPVPTLNFRLRHVTALLLSHRQNTDARELFHTELSEKKITYKTGGGRSA